MPEPTIKDRIDRIQEIKREVQAEISRLSNELLDLEKEQTYLMIQDIHESRT